MPTTSPRRRHLLLFVVAVVLPSLALVTLGIRLIVQEREIRLNRIGEDRKAALAEAQRLVQGALNGIENQVMRDLDAGRPFSSRDYALPEIRFVARVRNDRIIPPWEDTPADIEARRSLAEPRFAELMRRGQRAEIGAGDLNAARRLYLNARRAATSPNQDAMARLLVARTLAAEDQVGRAREAYGDLLATPWSVVDEHGVPIALYAAERLREWGEAGQLIATRLREAIAGREWRSPTALQMLLDLAHGIASPAELEDERVAVENALSIVDNAPLLLAARNGGDAAPMSAVGWLGVGRDDWLVKSIGATGATVPAVIAVSAKALALRLNASGRRPASAAALEISGDPEAEGTPLGVARPDLIATFLTTPEAALGSGMGPQNTFFAMTLLLVLGVTMFGGYLLLADVKREMRLGQLRSDFVSGVSHEVKTPLTSIRMFAEMLRSPSAREPAVTTEYLDTIVGESERLTRLLNNVLDASTIEQGQKFYSFEPASLADILRQAGRAIEYPFERDGFRLQVSLDDDLPPVLVDADAIEQAVLNLLTNAMKFSGDARDIQLTLRQEDGHAVIAVSDRGVGIPPHLRSRLTEKFYRTPSAQDDRIPGAGLGLAIVEHTVTAHGGRLTIDSIEGAGSTFSIHLPLDGPP